MYAAAAAAASVAAGGTDTSAAAAAAVAANVAVPLCRRAADDADEVAAALAPARVNAAGGGWAYWVAVEMAVATVQAANAPIASGSSPKHAPAQGAGDPWPGCGCGA
jgi:hypothetical protein